MAQQPKLMDQVRDVIRLKHYSRVERSCSVFRPVDPALTLGQPVTSAGVLRAWRKVLGARCRAARPSLTRFDRTWTNSRIARATDDPEGLRHHISYS
jgi:hypothetical protein